MESAGVFEAVAATGQDISIVVVRAIAGFADDSVDILDVRSEAAENAVTVALELIRRLPTLDTLGPVDEPDTPV